MLMDFTCPDTLADSKFFFWQGQLRLRQKKRKRESIKYENT